MRASLAQMIASMAGARMTQNVAFDGVSTDSRRVAAGSLFVALRGRRLDGELVAHEPLRIGGQRLQVGEVLRRLDRRRVLVAGFVGDVKQHRAGRWMGRLCVYFDSAPKCEA